MSYREYPFIGNSPDAGCGDQDAICGGDVEKPASDPYLEPLEPAEPLDGGYVEAPASDPVLDPFHPRPPRGTAPRIWTF